MKKRTYEKTFAFSYALFSCRHSVIIIETFRLSAQRDNH